MSISYVLWQIGLSLFTDQDRVNEEEVLQILHTSLQWPPHNSVVLLNVEEPVISKSPGIFSDITDYIRAHQTHDHFQKLNHAKPMLKVGNVAKLLS